MIGQFIGFAPAQTLVKYFTQKGDRLPAHALGLFTEDQTGSCTTVSFWVIYPIKGQCELPFPALID
ncbi:hypothetical protein ACW19B_06300 [Limosilactobacillus fermentum]